MLYKTTVLALLENHPKLYDHLRLSRTLLKELDRYASDLRTEHHRLTGEGTDRSAAWERATAEIESRIASEAARLEA